MIQGRRPAEFAAPAGASPPPGDTPLPLQLFSLDQLAKHAEALALRHRVIPHAGGDALLDRLADNEASLLAAHERLSAALTAKIRVSPAGEWLLDNFHLIEEQIRLAKRHLPPGYSRQLPHLGAGPSAGLPRVYDVALEIIAHVDGRIDAENVAVFVSSYQTRTPLSIGELWAIPIMLRLALIENLRRVAGRVVVGMDHRALAQDWAAKIRETGERDPKNLIIVAADMARAAPPLTNSFVAEFVQRLADKGTAADIPLTWIEQQLADAHSSIQQRVQSESQQQAANQVSVGGSIGSLRFLNAADWRVFVESMSVVEKVLRDDPAGVYADMDFATRDHYRHVVEQLARASRRPEPEVAEAAGLLAQAAAGAQRGAPEWHVGYYLLDEGLDALRKRLGLRGLAFCRVAPRARWGALYFGLIALVTAALPWALVARAGGSTALRVTLYALAAVCTSQLAVAFANWVVTALKRPATLPRLDFAGDIPDAFRTLVVVPTMLINPAQVEHLVEALEVRFLANREKNLQFGLLTDYTDAPARSTPDDAALLAAAERGIDALNARHAASGARFCLFHRPRCWNPGENAWIGKERKRGKLEALNALLRGGDEEFERAVGDREFLRSVRYVITLDTDTQLPRDAAHKLIGTMAHPLNHPRFDARLGRVVAGYGLLQPRVGVALPSARRSWFVRLNAGEPGSDPYTRAVSDVYQDLFGEGSYVGKGIYDVDAFTRALAPALPENRILSHDLIEGCYARSGLVSDVLLLEDHPHHFVEDVKRRRRWTRGDWQIASWLLPRVRLRDGSRASNPLSALSKWKIFDNLRRSLVPVAMLALLVVGWAGTGDGWLFVRAALLLALLVPLLAATAGLLRKPQYASVGAHLRFEARAGAKALAQALLALAFLPNDAANALDAVGRSCYRMLVSHKRLLEWRSATDPRHTEGWGVLSFLRSLAAGPLVGAATIAFLWARGAHAVEPALGFALLWGLSPFAAKWLSAPLTDADAPLAAGQLAALRRLSRKTWFFFETFVGEADNWLPPDNFQEHPTPVVAHRTSPTNIGMSLLANLAAYDFGYLPAAKLLERTRNTLTTMGRMERFRGHFYNWYDTQSLKPLHPLYVSSVDSGNLSGHLLVLEAGLRELADAPALSPRVWDGLADAVRAFADAAGRHPDPAARKQAQAVGESLGQLVARPQPGRSAALALAKSLLFALETLSPGEGAADLELKAWQAALRRQIEDGLMAPLAGLSGNDDDIPSLRALAAGSGPGAAAAAGLLDDAANLARQCAEFAAVEYDFLYDRTRHLLSIGYNAGDHRRDLGHYDLLASEARLISFVGIAEGDLPQEHWFALGRLLTSFGSEATLLSWSGSMFEYLMPLLVMPTFRGTLLDHTYQTVVRRQIEYGDQSGIPWGVSESGYNTTDQQSNYQYKAFGVPGLGFKRGLADDLVIAPYATVMALMVAPAAAAKNLERMRAAGFEGQYGFFEAIDYTPSRLAAGQAHAVVRSFMAHHQGMSLLSLAYRLLDQPMQRRFRARPSFQAAEPLLHERLPKVAAYYPHAREVSEGPQLIRDAEAQMRVVPTPHTPQPEVHLLSNGRYAAMLTNAGGGYSRWKDLALTRWREDPTADDWGSFLYVRDVQSGKVWSAAHQPTRKEAKSYEAIFPQARAEFRRRDEDLDLHTEIAVSPEDDIELRRYTLTNLSGKPREIELTTYAEVVLAPQASDEAHPAFSNLFVQTEIMTERGAILCTRRPRSDREEVPVLLHLMTVHGAGAGALSFETDRRAFLGRGRTAARPKALDKGAPADLGGSQGSVLDPVVAIRCRVRIAPEQSVSLHAVLGVGATRDDAVRLMEKYHDRHLADRVFELAWTHRQVVMRQLQISDADAQVYMRLAGSVLFAGANLRAKSSVIAKNRRGQASLWGYGISGDLPIVLLRIGSAEFLPIAAELIRAHSFWRELGLVADLVIWNEDDSGYRQDLQDRLVNTVHAGHAAQLLDMRGGIFIRRLEQMGEDDRVLMLTVARAVFVDAAGPLAEQVERRARVPLPLPALVPRALPEPVRADKAAARPPAVSLSFPNGLGGFAPGGDEYVLRLAPGQATPAPWVNVIANPYFGTVVSESGGAYTWCENSHEYRVTPWSNDALTDMAGEAFYLRDEDTGQVWSPAPFPVRGAGAYETRHGFGYTVFAHEEAGIRSEMTVFVAIDAPVKLTVIKLANKSQKTRNVSLTGYTEWVLGELRSKTMMHVVTEIDPTNGAVCARNSYHPEFGARIGFFDVSEAGRTTTADRGEFLGRNGRVRDPAAMKLAGLSGRVGTAMDPCAAIQTVVSLAPGEERSVTFVLGVGRDADDARTLIRRFAKTPSALAALADARDHWRNVLSAVQVETPDPAVDVLLNGWLPYQVIACRLWARTGFYQSGGAFGFRDQLQDAMALLHTHPRLLREQILRCAGRQYVEGDVQHWWHPPAGFGVRTHFSDDYLWLPLATARYVLAIGDTGVLDVRSAFIEGRQVKPDEEAYGDQPRKADESGTLYEHCVRSIQRGLRFGKHGLPLMGCGDWNDGMNLVGERGKGESVWLGFFLYSVLIEFAKVARLYGDTPFAETCAREAEQLKGRVEAEAWDGAWYRRAYFDDGQPLGSAANSECQIDSLPQSWAVLSGAGDTARARQAMEAVNERLVDRGNSLIKLFDPPFDRADPNPGYIKGYVPGVRENGGQYTHAAIWTTMAFAALGDGERAWELARMINPLSHGGSAAGVARYLVEPYVVAADVYAVAPHTGRGGWTWYTGSAAWMYRLFLESLLGVTLAVDRLVFKPCVPAGWEGFTMRYRFRSTSYRITLKRGPTPGVYLDGSTLALDYLPLVDDAQEHAAEVVF